MQATGDPESEVEREAGAGRDLETADEGSTAEGPATSVLGIKTDVDVATAVEAVGQRRSATLANEGSDAEVETARRQFSLVAGLAAAVEDHEDGFRLRDPNY